ncbi:MAG TPA: FAD-dependent oxidoreductase [Flavobacteriaceae bacterium]|nr:FAD-dependent oxidoreductase [Flavobacteriaceae bacterium]
MLDYLIIGFGLGGSCLAHQLEKKNKRFLVFENGSQQSSKVAGGLFNPVVLKRYSLAWNADQQLKTALPFYRSLEKKLQTNFLKSVTVLRKFNSTEEQNNWFAAADKALLSPFLNTDLIKKHSKIPSNYGFGQVEQTGTVDTQSMLVAHSEYLAQNKQFVATSFEHALLKIEKGFVQYKNHKARRIVFCEGFGMLQNPFFNYLPLQGNKGEYIIVEIPGLNLKEIVKASVFIIPLGNDRYKVGATYDRDFENQLPSISAKEELVQKLEKIIAREYTIIDQVAGIRPTVSDRKPLVGQHPTYPNMYVCNGFGSRGVLVGPTAVQKLFAFMEEKKPLPEEVDIRRFD